MSDPRSRFHPRSSISISRQSAELLATARDLEALRGHRFDDAERRLRGPRHGRHRRGTDARPVGRGFLATVRDASTIAFGPGRPIAVRAQAFALLLALSVAVGSVGTVAVVGAARLLGQDGTPPPTVPTPSPSPSLFGPVAVPIDVAKRQSESESDAVDIAAGVAGRNGRAIGHRRPRGGGGPGVARQRLGERRIEWLGSLGRFRQ